MSAGGGAPGSAGALGLFETMRVEGGAVLRLDAHLERLARSAERFGIPLDPQAARALALEAAARPGAPLRRLRLDLHAGGALGVVTSAIEDGPPGRTVRVALAHDRVAADDERQRHKTTQRERYDRAATWAREHGLADVLFLNRAGTVAEGAVSTVFVRRGTKLVTPPVEDGALPGVLRAELLAAGEAVEGSVRPEELAGELYLGSALRGLRCAALDPAGGPPPLTAPPRRGAARRSRTRGSTSPG